jgi:hypothetical protein
VGGLREWRFRRRITFEREILAAVNNAVTGTEPLVGLTETAIANWRCKLISAQLNVNSSVVESILEVSRRLRLDTDSSRDVFHGESLRKDVSVEELLTKLLDELRRIPTIQALS